MKKTFLLLTILVSATIVNAQTSVGVYGSVISAGADINSGGTKYNSKYITSWKSGLVLHLKMGDKFGFMPNLNILSKGFSSEETQTATFGGFPITTTTNSKLKYTYLEIPLNFVYNTDAFFIGIGPSFSYGLSGTAIM
jgi:hypothetical protein